MLRKLFSSILGKSQDGRDPVDPAGNADPPFESGDGILHRQEDDTRQRREFETRMRYFDILHDTIMRHEDYWSRLYEQRRDRYPAEMTRMQVFGLTAFIQAAGADFGSASPSLLRRTFGSLFPSDADLKAALDEFVGAQTVIYDGEADTAPGPRNPARIERISSPQPRPSRPVPVTPEFN